jgi:hypothetical protein
MMFTFKHTIIVMMLLVGGFVACGDSGSGSTPDAISLGQGGALGTGGSGAGGTSVSIDGAAGSGSSQVLDAAAFDTVAVDMSGPVVDAMVSEAGLTPVSCAGTKVTNLAIINALPAAGVVAVDVQGTAPPTYDPSSSTCK